MIERFNEAIDNSEEFGALLTDLSKAFDCIDHNLLIAKLHSYGIDLSSLRIVASYLSERTSKTKIKESYSTSRTLLYGVPQRSILGPLLFNIYLADLFLFCENTDIASYADDTTPYICDKDVYGY